jgi:glycosyltransferase involved in cell wall biosynthesis
MARLAGPVTSELGVPAGGHLRDIVGLSPAAVNDINQLDRLWAVSQATSDYHVAQGVVAGKLRVLYNGIDTEKFSPKPHTGRLIAELQFPSDSRILATIGQLVQRKGVDLTLEAFIAAAADLPNWHLVIVGERYSQKEEARQFEAGLYQRRDCSAVADRIHFLGHRDDVGELLPEIDLLVHSARQEPLGRVLLEAAACGLPVVASDVGGTREIFEIADSSGHSTAGPMACELVPAGDVVALATAIRRLAGDAPLREHLGRVSRRVAQSRFEIRVRGPAIAAAYRELLNSAGAVEKSPSICYNNER